MWTSALLLVVFSLIAVAAMLAFLFVAFGVAKTFAGIIILIACAIAWRKLR